jgi:serine/threonine-protein kinase
MGEWGSAPAPAALAEPSAAAVGERYALRRLLARGGMGEAWLAFDGRLEREVVVKRPSVDGDGGAAVDARRRFAREVGWLSRLEHPHVIKVLDASRDEEGTPFVVLPYLCGGSLEARIASEGRRPLAEVREWLPGLASALDHVHAKGLLHRDVKPDNVLFDEDGNAVLADFGLAAPIEPHAEALGGSGVDGSPDYMAPEAFDGPLGRAYDQYALALVAFEALTGSFPHDAPGPVARFVARRHVAPRTVAATGVRAPACVERAFRRAFSVDPRRRFRSCSRFAEAFAG